MPLVPPPVGMAVFLAAIIVSRIVQERALRKLSTEEKGQLVEAFSGLRLFSLIPLAALAGLYFLMMSLEALTSTLLLTIFLPATVLFSVVMQVLIHRRLRSLSLHPDYVRAYAIGRGLFLAAFILLLLSI